MSLTYEKNLVFLQLSPKHTHSIAVPSESCQHERTGLSWCRLWKSIQWVSAVSLSVVCFVEAMIPVFNHKTLIGMWVPRLSTAGNLSNPISVILCQYLMYQIPYLIWQIFHLSTSSFSTGGDIRVLRGTRSLSSCATYWAKKTYFQGRFFLKIVWILIYTFYSITFCLCKILDLVISILILLTCMFQFLLCWGLMP